MVAIDEHGDRQLVVVSPATTRARDTNPAISPDDRFVVFASSRGRAFDETSLWIAPVAPDASSRALTSGPAIDSQPTWVPDGSAIVFARATPGGNFDLYRLAIDRNGNARGEPEQLTSGPGHEVTPSVAHDGAIVYAEVTPHRDGSAGVDSHLELRTPDGVIVRLTDGPADTTPAFSPDDKTIAFSAAIPRTTTGGDMVDADLCRIKATGGGGAERIVDLPLTDESGPVWSADGHFLFATSALRDSKGKAVFSSVIEIDMQADPRVARMLEDHAGLFPRLTPALTHVALDPKALDADPEYLPELARLLAPAMAQAKAR